MILTDPRLWLFVLLASPIGGGFLSLIPLGRWSERVSRLTATVSWVAASVLLATQATAYWSSYFSLDPLSDLFVFLVASIYASSTWYSRGYLSGVREPFLTPQVYYALLNAFAFAMLLTLVVGDLGLMWIGVEATTVASALLIVLERKPTSVEAAWRYTLIASAGLTVALFALLLLYDSAGTLNAHQLATHPPALTVPIAMAASLALVGYGTKIGLFPMHTWLPDAHSEAPSPVSALFSGVLLPTALYAFLRVYAIIPAPVPASLSDLVIAFGLTTALVAAFLMQRQSSFKRLLAYSSMENMGIAVVGVGIGGIALYGALILIVAHAFAKSASFYCAGNVLRRYGTTRIENVRGLRERMPLTGATWVLSGLAVTGAPPFGTFVGEVLILVGAVAVGGWWIVVGLAVALLTAFLGLNRQIGGMVFGAPVGPNPPSWREGAWDAVIPLVNVGVALLLGIVALPYLGPAIHSAAAVIGGAGP
jgi:hydrogenase-4 component F